MASAGKPGLSTLQMCVAAFGALSLCGDALGKSPVQKTREKLGEMLSSAGLPRAIATDVSGPVFLVPRFAPQHCQQQAATDAAQATDYESTSLPWKILGVTAATTAVATRAPDEKPAAK